MVTASFTNQPQNASTISGGSATFSFTVSIQNSVYNSPTLQWEVFDGATWTQISSNSTYSFSVSSVTPGIVNGQFIVSNVSLGMNGFSYRATISDSREGYSETSNIVTLGVISKLDWCKKTFIECGGTMAYADCGLINEPGFTSKIDCSICECVKTANTPAPTPTPTLTPKCKYIECGGSLLYADCGMAYELGFTYVMDCDLCKCVKVPNEPSCPFIECGGNMAYADCELINEPGFRYVMNCDICKCVKVPAPTPTPTQTPRPTKVTPTPTPTLTPTPTPTPTRTPTPTPKSTVTVEFASQPRNISVKSGGSGSFEFTAVLSNSVYNSPELTWQVSRDAISWKNVPNNTSMGAMSVTPGTINGFMQLSNISTNLSGNFYRARIRDTRESFLAYSAVARINILPPAARISVQPSTATVVVGEATSFNFEAIVSNPTGIVNPLVKWQYSKNLSGWSDVKENSGIYSTVSLVGDNPLTIRGSLNLSNTQLTYNGGFFRALCLNKTDGYYLVTASSLLIVNLA